MVFDARGSPTEARGLAEKAEAPISAAGGPESYPLLTPLRSKTCFTEQLSPYSWLVPLTRTWQRGTALIPTYIGGRFFPKSFLSHPPKFSQEAPLSHGNRRCQRNPRIKSFIVLRAIVIGLGTPGRLRWDSLGPRCRGIWRLWQRGRAQPTVWSPVACTLSVGTQ